MALGSLTAAIITFIPHGFILLHVLAQLINDVRRPSINQLPPHFKVAFSAPDGFHKLDDITFTWCVNVRQGMQFE